MKRLLFLSGKGGTGKTILASAFVKLSKAEVCVDLNIAAPHLHQVFDQQSKRQKQDQEGWPVAHINDAACMNCGRCQKMCAFSAIALDGKPEVDRRACMGCRLCEVFCPNKAIVMSKRIAGSVVRQKSLNHTVLYAEALHDCPQATPFFAEFSNALDREFSDASYVIIDGPSGSGSNVIEALRFADLALIVVEPSIFGISDMERLIKTIESRNVLIAVCINRFDINLRNAKIIEDYCRDRKIAFVGRIPHDKSIYEAINQENAIVDIDCPAYRAVNAVYRKTMDLLVSV